MGETTQIQTSNPQNLNKSLAITSNKLIQSSAKPLSKSDQWSKSGKQSDFLTALENNLGLIHNACEAIGIRYSTLQKWKQDQVFLDKYNLVTERINERIEKKLFDRFDDINPASLIFYLRTRNPKYKDINNITNNIETNITITNTQETLKSVAGYIKQLMIKSK